MTLRASCSGGRPIIEVDPSYAANKFQAVITLDGKRQELIVTLRENAASKQHQDRWNDISDDARFIHEGGNAVRVSETQVRSPAFEGGTSKETGASCQLLAVDDKLG